MHRRGSENLASPIGMSDHAPQAFGTDIKCRLTEIKCFFGNLLSVYTMYADNIPFTTCFSIPFYETELTIGKPVPELVRFTVPEL